MQRNGFDANEPIRTTVVNGRRIIIDGHHRARAAGSAGIRQVPVTTETVSPSVGDMLFRQAAEAAQMLGLPF